ncbi:MAG: type IV secretion system protein, partial [Alphaproteobacteria bacterium]|nr:type IV secretion system protein [Alphaproteobacteria bacterium]
MIRTKKIILILLGLLTIAVTSAYAQNSTGNSEAKITIKNIIKTESEFMQENSADAGWKDYIGAGKSLVSCGVRKCNLAKKKCLKKVETASFDFWATFKRYTTKAGTHGLGGAAGLGGVSGGTLAGTGLALGMVDGVISEAAEDGYSRTAVTSYKCVNPDEVDEYKKDGYFESDGGLNTTVETSARSGKVLGIDTDEVEDEQCYKAKRGTDKDQKVTQYCLEMNDDTVRIYNGHDNEKDCEVIPVKLYQQQQCLFCSFMGSIFKVADKMTVLSYEKLASSFAIVIVVGLMIWIAGKTLIFVSSMTKQDAAKYITEMLKQSYKFAIAYFLLIFYEDVFIYIIDPLLTAGITFGNKFIESDIGFPRENFWTGNAFDAPTTHTLADLKALGSELPRDYAANLENVFWKFETYALLEHFAHNVNLNFSLLQVIGNSLICNGMYYIGNHISELGLGMISVLYGCVWFVLGFLLSLAFIFYMLDAIVQLGIVGALLPFLIASWPFKMSAKWTNSGFKICLNSVFCFMLMGVLAGIIVQLMDEAARANTEGGKGGITELIEALDARDTEKLRSMVNVFSVGFLMFLFASFIGFLMLGKISDVVNRFAAGGMKGISPVIATMGASAVKGL